jgi:hypothetical protein
VGDAFAFALVGPEAYFGLYKQQNIIGGKGDVLFALLNKVAEKLDSTAEGERLAAEMLDEERISRSVSDLRSY